MCSSDLFIVFFVTDAYGFVNWSIMNKRQKAGEEKDLSEAERIEEEITTK